MFQSLEGHDLRKTSLGCSKDGSRDDVDLSDAITEAFTTDGMDG